MCDIKRAIFAESEVKTKKKGFHFGNPHISAGLLSHFLLLLYGFMHILPFMDVYKKKPSDPKEFSGDPTLGRSPYVENHGFRLLKLQLCFEIFR